VIKFDRFSFTYWGRPAPALKDLDLRICDGERLLVAGPSGSGKSTLARCLNGLVPHFYGGQLEGRVLIDGLDVTRTQPRELATRVGMVFQDPENQLVASDVERDVAFGPENLGLEPSEIARRVDDVLQSLGLSHLRHRPLSSLSGGEKQKAVIAGVLALHPRVLVLDEPTSELDPASAQEFFEMLSGLQWKLGLTVILIEHRIERVAAIVDRVVLLCEGQVIADGRPCDVLDSHESAQLGVGAPPVTQLAWALRAKGLWAGMVPLTVEQARDTLESALRTVGATCDAATHQSSEPVVSVKSLTHQYDGDMEPALADVDVLLPDGSVCAIMGRNGSGKTTLVKHFNGLLKPTSGSVYVCGTDVRESTVARMARMVGLVFQNPNDHLFAETVEDELRFTLVHQGVPRAAVDARVEQALALFGLTSLRFAYPRSLSGGERQRVALASVLVARPRVLVLDEPTRGMESALRRVMSSLLREYAAGGNLVVLVTHDVEMAVEDAEHVLLLSSGKTEGYGEVKTVLDGHPVFASQINQLVHSLRLPVGPLATVDDLLEALS